MDVSGCRNITGAGFQVLKEKFTNLEKLSLPYCGLTQQGLLELLRMCGRKLQDLDVSWTNITGEGLEELQGKFVELKTQNLEFCYSISDQGLREIINIAGPLL